MRRFATLPVRVLAALAILGLTMLVPRILTPARAAAGDWSGGEFSSTYTTPGPHETWYRPEYGHCLRCGATISQRTMVLCVDCVLEAKAEARKVLEDRAAEALARRRSGGKAKAAGQGNGTGGPAATGKSGEGGH